MAWAGHGHQASGREAHLTARSPGNIQSQNLPVAGWGPWDDKGMSLKVTKLEKMEGRERQVVGRGKERQKLRAGVGGGGRKDR